MRLLTRAGRATGPAVLCLFLVPGISCSSRPVEVNSQVPWHAAPPELASSADARYGPYQAASFRIGGGTVRLLLSSGKRQVSDVEILQWVRAAARAVTSYYGHYPVRQVLVVVQVTGPRKIGHGEEFDGGLIRVHIGQATTPRDLQSDWIMTHEMFHLAFPDLGPEYSWMNEGLSDYLEPVARARLGMISDQKLWGEMVQGLPQGLPQAGDQGLDRTHTWGRTYWGGTLYWLLADIRIREQTHNRRSLRDALRAILDAGGNGSRTWSLRRVLEVGDRATGTHVMSDLHEEMGLHPWAPNLPELWRRLGVRLAGSQVNFDGSAPLAWVRRSIARTPGP